MDTFAHGIWSFIVFGSITNPWLAVFFGIAPDLFSWTIYIIYKTMVKKEKFGPPDLNTIPKWAFTLYGITHGVFTIAIAFTLTYIFTGAIPIYLWAWPLHVAIDIPTHSKDFLPTPFLWPISDWKFPGISWAQKWFMIINYGSIILALILILL